MNERNKQTMWLILSVLGAAIFLILSLRLKVQLQGEVTLDLILGMGVSMLFPALSVKQLISNENEFMTQNGVPKRKKILNLITIGSLIFGFIFWYQNFLKIVSLIVYDNESLRLISEFGSRISAVVVVAIMFAGYFVYSSKGVVQQVMQEEKSYDILTTNPNCSKLKSCIKKVLSPLFETKWFKRIEGFIKEKISPISFYLRRQKIAWLLLMQGTSILCCSLVMYIVNTQVFGAIVDRQSEVILFAAVLICTILFAWWLKNNPKYTFGKLMIAIVAFLVVLIVVTRVLSLDYYSYFVVVFTSLGCIASVGGLCYLNPIRK